MWTRASLVLLATLVLAACGGRPEQSGGPTSGQLDEQTTEMNGPTTTMKRRTYDPGELAGSRWTLLSLNGRALVGGTKISLRFREDAFRGNAGCNFYASDGLRTDGGRLDIGIVEMTMMGCKGPVGEQESAYLDALGKAKMYRLRGARLEFRDASGETILTFRKEQA